MNEILRAVDELLDAQALFSKAHGGFSNSFPGPQGVKETDRFTAIYRRRQAAFVNLSLARERHEGSSSEVREVNQSVCVEQGVPAREGPSHQDNGQDHSI